MILARIYFFPLCASIGSATFVGCAASRSIGFASIARLVDDRRSRMASRHWRDKILLTVL
jgi:hypothetical protein